ncbi:family 20 glycosylhydrolase [Algivirga pacifica]|uniref:beta-N-acetylhexosaminidase n=1 Tax=Algivirga pacifica TaxID=1162670 RepID=A0ABP9DQ52_9BACT
MPENDLTLQQTATLLQGYIKIITGKELPVKHDTSSKGIMLVVQEDTTALAEAYHLNVSPTGIQIQGSDAKGVFYGIQTLRQLLVQNTTTLPALSIQDAPRFSYRGMHLDVGRHMYPVEFIKRYIDLIALHKMNTFHWHLTEDQGWRIEIKKYPKLTTVGAYRKETVVGHAGSSKEYDGQEYGGFYTQEEVKEIVQYAKDRHITVIPEIELPGHSRAALAAYPELGCTGGPYTVATTFGIFEDVYCAGNEQTFQFMTDVLDEVMALFPSTYIHIGGDECPKESWEKCPKCQKRIKAEGLEDEHALQSYFITRIEQYLNSKGRNIIGWDEILEGGLAPNATVMSWRGIKGGIAAAQQGHDVVMTPGGYLYFDHYQTQDRASEPIRIGGYTSVERVYNYEPIPEVLSKEESRHILGAQANVWTEYLKTSKEVEYMVLPRMAALSEVLWTAVEGRQYESFKQRLGNLLQLYKLHDYHFAKHIFEVDIKTIPIVEKGHYKVVLSTMKGGNIYYTTDGSVPNEQSIKYQGDTLIFEEATQLKVVAYYEDTPTKVKTVALEKSLTTFKPLKIKSTLSPGYQKDLSCLNDGLRGTSNFKSDAWIGTQQEDLQVVIDLKEVKDIQEVQVGNYVGVNNWIFGARGVKVETSEDSLQWAQVARQSYPISEEKETNTLKTLQVTWPAVKARFVKVTVEKQEHLPEWHKGKGAKAFLFVDEIRVL